MRISKEYTFEAAHHLPNVPPNHQCARVHGHSYRVIVELEGPIDPVFGWVVDFGAITAAWKVTGALLDHTDLNDRYPNPTAELLAADLAAQIAGWNLPVSRVTVCETDTSKAVWEA